MKKEVVVILVVALLIGGFIFFGRIVGYVVQGDERNIFDKWREIFPGKNEPVKRAGPPTLIVILQDKDGGVVDANVRIHLKPADFKLKEGNLGELENPVISVGNKGKKQLVFNTLLIESKKESETFIIKVESLDYWDETKEVTLFHRREEVVIFSLNRREKDSRDVPCVDSDKGIMSLVPGKTTLTLVPKLGVVEEKRDRCEGTKLVEYSCKQYWNSDEGEMYKIIETNLTCPLGCFNGACVAQSFCRDGVCIASENLSCDSYYNNEGENLFLRTSASISQRWEEPKEPEPKLVPGKVVGRVIDEPVAAPALPAPKPVIAGKPELQPEEGRLLFEEENRFERPTRLEFNLDSSCVDEQTITRFVCEPYAIFQGIVAVDKISKDFEDKSRYPQEKKLKCPEGYSCNRGKCVQRYVPPSATYGDVNADGAVNQGDIFVLQTLLGRNLVPYEAAADLDNDKYVDSYDLYLLQRFIRGEEKADLRLPVRSFNLAATRLYQWGSYASSALEELKLTGNNKKYTTEHQQKGNSRSLCKPPVLNVKFKKKDLFYGWTTYPGFSLLGYQKVKFIPDCDILSPHEVDNQLREYIIYSAFRNFGVPTMDIAAFALVQFNASDQQDNGQSHQYMLLQRDDEKDDQIPFLKQFNLRELVQDNDDGVTYSADYDASESGNDRFSKVTVRLIQEGQKPETRELKLDPNTSIRHTVLTEFFGLQDRSVLWNEHYGLDARTGLWKQIPFDLDSSFGCYSGGYSEILRDAIESLSKEEQKLYQENAMRITREIFDNPDTMHYLLSLVDRYPFEENRDKMKYTLRLLFYQHALYYGSSEFAKQMQQPYSAFVNQERYLKEAQRIIAQPQYDTVCSQDDMRNILRGALRLYGISSDSDKDKIPEKPAQNAIAPVGPPPGAVIPEKARPPLPGFDAQGNRLP